MRTVATTLAVLLAATTGACAAPADTGETGAPTPWAGAPVVLRVSDAVRPGEVIGLYGEGLGEGLRVVVAAGALTTRPAGALEAKTLHADHHGQFAMVEVPASLPAGPFTFWAANAAGWCGRPTVANLPRPQWLSEYEAWPGQTVRLVGYNLLATEFGARAGTRVRLVPEGGKAVAAPVRDVNPFAITVAVPLMPEGRCRVEVSNNGGAHWGPVPGEGLTVVRTGKDPLGLGVAWAGAFAWDRRVNVADLQSGPADATAAIQRAIDACRAAGGGVVAIPAGEFRVASLRLPAGVVLLGEGQERTTLLYTGSGAPAVGAAGDGTVEGRHGVARLTIQVAPGNALPDCFLVLGQPWGPAASDCTLRTATRLFCHQVTVEYDQKTPVQDGHRGLGLLAIGKERCLISGCTFRGYYAPPHRVLLDRYFLCHDNEMEFSNGTLVTTAACSVIERNHLVGHRENVPDEARNPSDIHGIFARDHLYAAENLIEGMGVHEGEAICVENPNACKTYGKVLSSDGPRLSLESAVPFDWSSFDPAKRYFGDWHVVIVAGRGLGQYRRVVKAEGPTVTVGRPWEVAPDASSRFSIVLLNEHVIMYRNTARDCTKGFWFYGNAIDGVAADNVSDNAEGVFANAYHTPAGVYSMVYFIRMARNRVQGVSPRTHHAGVGFSTSRTSLRTYYGVHSLGIEVRENEIRGVPGEKPFAGSECPLVSGVLGVFYSGFEGGAGCDRVGTIIARNRLSDLAAGITLGRDNCGTVLSGNEFARVKKPVFDAGSRGLVGAPGE